MTTGMWAVGLALGAPREGASGGMVFVIQMVAIFAIFYFLLIRPQRQAQKRHQHMLSELKRGDDVVTEGGIVGTVVHLAEDQVTVKSGDTRLIVMRSKIARVGRKEEAKES
ncbi:MAG TPA: preprotein translocase subunit YajC [Longimicrobiales bacterium]|nr:preprotein translocase subunit YajC [Longimicrobiales bacterium]